MDGRRDDVGRPGLLLVLDGPGGVGEQQLLGYRAQAEVLSWLAVLYFRLSSEQIWDYFKPVNIRLSVLTCNIVDQSDCSSAVFAYLELCVSCRQNSADQTHCKAGWES